MAPNLPPLDHTELTSHSMTLRNRLALVDPSRLRSSTLLPKIERRVNISDSFDVIKLLLVKDIGVTICGGIIGASGSQTCFDAVFQGKSLVLLNHTMLKQRIY